MFNNLRFTFINNEILAYNDKVVGLFSTYRTTANHAIHQLENRKLTTAEIDEFLEKLDEDDLEEANDLDQAKEMLDKIVKFYPESKYIVHGLRAILAAKRTPREVRKDQKVLKEKMAKKEAKDEQRRKREGREKPVPKPKKEKQEQPAEPKVTPEIKETKETKETKEAKPIEDERPLSKVGKTGLKGGETGFKGFKNILFNIFKSLEDPTRKNDREELQKRIRKNWPAYKKNEKILNENKELMEALQDRIEEKDISPESILLMNELIARDPSFAKELDLDEQKPESFEIPIEKLQEKFRDIDVSKDTEVIIEAIKKVFSKEKINLDSISIYSKGTEKIADIALKDWDSFFKIANLLKLKFKDISLT